MTVQDPMPAKVVGALLGNADNEKDRDMPCWICGKPTPLPGFLVNTLKVWNREIDRRARQEPPRASPSDLMRITDVQIACPGECNAELYRRNHARVQDENATTIAFWRMLLVGKYNDESLLWLRKHGYSTRVARVLGAEGNKSHG